MASHRRTFWNFKAAGCQRPLSPRLSHVEPGNRVVEWGGGTCLKPEVAVKGSRPWPHVGTPLAPRSCRRGLALGRGAQAEQDTAPGSLQERLSAGDVMTAPGSTSPGPWLPPVQPHGTHVLAEPCPAHGWRCLPSCFTAGWGSEPPTRGHLQGQVSGPFLLSTSGPAERLQNGALEAPTGAWLGNERQSQVGTALFSPGGRGTLSSTPCALALGPTGSRQPPGRVS